MWEKRGAGKGPGGQEGWCWSDIIPVGLKVCRIRDPRGKWPRSSKRTLVSEAGVQGCSPAIPNSRMWAVKPGTPGPQEAQARALPGIWAPGNTARKSNMAPSCVNRSKIKEARRPSAGESANTSCSQGRQLHAPLAPAHPFIQWYIYHPTSCWTSEGAEAQRAQAASLRSHSQ